MKGLRKVTRYLIVFVAVIGLALAGCSGGSSSSAIPASSGGTDGTGGSDDGGAGAVGEGTEALSAAERISLVDAQDDSSSILLRGIKKLQEYASTDLPADSQFNTDVTVKWVHERSAEALDIVQEILCSFDQTGYAEMLNQGDYLAQINLTACESQDSASSQGQSSQNQSSGDSVTEYEMWTVNSYKKDDESGTPHIVSAWIHEDNSSEEDSFDPSMIIHAKMVIEESRSDTNPGVFKLDFKGLATESLGGGMVAAGDEIMHGYLQSTKDETSTNANIEFFCQMGNDMFSMSEKLALTQSLDGTTGSGTIAQEFTSPFEEMEDDMSGTFNVAYNSDYFYRSDGTNNVCLDRNNFHNNVWRYNLYYDENASSPGSRVSVNAGFPIKYTNDDAQDFHGWVGYYGLWMPWGASLSNGDTVYKMDYGPGADENGTAYTAFIVNGKLIKHTKMTLTLEEIAGTPLWWSSCSENGCSEFRVEWNSTLQKLYKTGTRGDESNNYMEQDIDPVEVTFGDNDWDFNFWSNSLQGNGFVRLKDPNTGENVTFTNETAVTFHKSTTVYPGDSGVPTSLACFEQCPDATPAIIEASSWEAGDNSYTNLAQNTAPGSLVAGTHYAAYTFDTTSMLLKYNGEAVVMTESSDDYQWGLWTGAFIDVDDLSSLACDWDSDKTCPWQAYQSLSSYYTWETGANEWNKLTMLKDPSTSEYLEFDPPLMVKYTTSNDTKIFLEYNGFGDLWGIPGKCIDADSGEEVSCHEGGEEGKHVRWVPEFSIGEGETVVNTSDNTTTYYVKPMEMEQHMLAVDEANCTASLALETQTLPDGSSYSDPEIGDQPEVGGAPAVVGGICQVCD